MLKKFGTLVFVVLSLLYPCLVYFGLQRWSYQIFGAMIIAVGLGRFGLSYLTNTSRSHPAEHTVATKANAVTKNDVLLLLLSILCGVAIWVFPSELAVKLYPVIISGFVGSLFALSLLQPEALITRIARLREGELPPAAIGYTRNLTAIWAILLYVNALVALYLAHFGTTHLWTLYCGFLSYLILGGFMGGELLFRHYFRRQQRLRDGGKN